jgi:hypothetical protein
MSAQSAPASVIEVERVLGETDHRKFQFMLLALCGLCLVVDGFDAQAMGYVAPSVIGEWRVSKAALGPVQSQAVYALRQEPRPVGKEYTVGFEAVGTIKRGDFGVTTFLPAVGDDVKLTIAGAFELQE